jgi:hypothetical protein
VPPREGCRLPLFIGLLLRPITPRPQLVFLKGTIDMSYLSAVRLHFAGRFQADVSTVNNDPAHFDNAAFRPDYQKMQGPNMKPPNGWFNPEGDAAFRLRGCRIASAWLPSGRVPDSDPALHCSVADSDDSVCAKLVDLDSEQQLVSEIWGLRVRIASANGATLMSGDFDPAAFIDIWDRATGPGGGDVGAGAAYQSVLRNLQWAEVSASPFLTALRQAAEDGLLSIKFNVDGMNMDFTSPDFMTGRIAGTIGPSSRREPQHLVIGRQFMANAGSGGNFFTPLGGINFCPAVVDAEACCLFLDLGNALTTASPGGPINNLGDLTVSVANSSVALGTIRASGLGGYAQSPAWHEDTAGVVALPLTETQIELVSTAPLAIAGNPGILINEWPNGAFVRADKYVWRMSPGDRADIPVYATQFGRPLPHVTVAFAQDSSQLQAQVTPDSPPFVGAAPPVATPSRALAFNATAMTDANGLAILSVQAHDPGTPRWFNNGADYGIDGQVYGVRPAFADLALTIGPINQWNFISFLVWSGFTPSNPVTWADVQPILQQYANLYPVMNRFLNLADYESAKTHAHLLLLAFGLDPADPNAMPVTRDLSPAKRAAILAWLKNPLPGPVREVPPRPTATEAADPTAAAIAAASRGGKAAAAARRLILQSR